MGGTKKSLWSLKNLLELLVLNEKLRKEETSKRSGKVQQKQKLSVLVEESQGRRAIQSTKAITIQGVARALGVKISVANTYIKSLETKGNVKSAG
jgi:small subunit ribosomal protein S25e